MLLYSYRVPNIVYGYDKTIGDYFNLEINTQEADIVRQIYRWYLHEGCGAARKKIFVALSLSVHIKCRMPPVKYLLCFLIAS